MTAFPNPATVRLNSSLSIAAEILLILVAIALNVLVAYTVGIPSNLQATLTLCTLLALIALSWIRFDGGMHPCFLFLCMLLVFQGGRIMATFFGSSQDVFQVDLQGVLPFDVPEQSRVISLLLLSLSAAIIYCTSLGLKRKRKPATRDFSNFAPYALIVFLLFYPLHAYKTLTYLQYVLRYGYTALYFDNGQHMKDVGLHVRIGSQISQAAFALYFCWEPSLRRLRWWALPIFVTTIAELAMGLRGHSLLIIFSFLFLYKLRSNGRFSLRLLAPLVTIMLFVSLFVANFRENIEDEGGINPVTLFLDTQGISFGVTELAVANRTQFERYRWNYLFYPIFGEFRHQSEFESGQRLAIDLSVYLDAHSFSEGYATGSSYLAESYLLGGISGVILVSMAMAGFLCLLNKWLADWRGPLAVGLLASVLFVPRSEIIVPLSAGIKAGGSLAVALVLVGFLHLCKYLGNLSQCRSAVSS